jgi:hypothetical protein
VTEDPLQRVPQAANLTVVIGVGRAGASTLAELTGALQAAPEINRRSIATWDANDATRNLADATASLLAQKNLDAIEQLGYRIPTVQVGQPLRVYGVFIVDLDDGTSSKALEGAFAQLAALKVNDYRAGWLLTRATLAACLSAPLATRAEWDVVLPVPAADRIGGERSDEDVIATVARTVLILSVPGAAASLPSVLSRSADAAARPLLLRAGAAFVDAKVETLLERLANLVAARLLRDQFADPKPFQPAASYDPQGITKTESLVVPESLARALLASTPFVLGAEANQPWTVRLSAAETAVNLHGVLQRRWVAILRKLKDFFDFTKARHWRETVEASAGELTQSVKASMLSDVQALYRCERGPDRVLAWSERLRTRLEVPVEIAMPRTGEFANAVDSLRDEIAIFPDGVGLASSMALAGLLGAGAAWTVCASLGGLAVGAIGVALTLMIAAGIGASIYQRAHRRLMRAREHSLQALSGYYEVQMRGNLAEVLERTRRSLLAYVEALRTENRRICEITVSEAASLERRLGDESQNGIVNVESPILPAMVADFLTHLALPWGHVIAEAAGQDALLPVVQSDQSTFAAPVESALAFARRYLQSHKTRLSLREQLAFRGQLDTRYVEQLVRNLDRRSAALVTGVGVETTWCGPPDLLALLRGAVPDLGGATHEEPVELELLACVRLAEQSQSPGGPT